MICCGIRMTELAAAARLNTCIPSRISIGLLAFMLFSLIYSSASLASNAVQAIQPDDSELEQVRLLFKEGKVLYTEMTHIFTDAYTGETQIVTGKLWISGEKYKIRTENQIVLVDGAVSKVYNQQQNKLVVSQYEPEEDEFAPSRFFSGTDEIFKVAEVTRRGGTIHYTLVSEDPFEVFTKVTIILNNDLSPLEIIAIDQMENEFRTIFRNAHYQEYSSNLFAMDFPEDAEVIDMSR